MLKLSKKGKYLQWSKLSQTAQLLIGLIIFPVRDGTTNVPSRSYI